MASTGSNVSFNDRCGYLVPCPGGASCGCASRESSSNGGDEPKMQHMRCPCGDHCGCNPCSCDRTPVSGTGRDFCKCSDGRACATCTA